MYIRKKVNEKQVFKPVKEKSDDTATLSKSSEFTCVESGKIGHARDKC